MVAAGLARVLCNIVSYECTENIVVIIVDGSHNRVTVNPPEVYSPAINIQNPSNFIDYPLNYQYYTDLNSDILVNFDVPKYLPYDSYSYTNNPTRKATDIINRETDVLNGVISYAMDIANSSTTPKKRTSDDVVYGVSAKSKQIISNAITVFNSSTIDARDLISKTFLAQAGNTPEADAKTTVEINYKNIPLRTYAQYKKVLSDVAPENLGRQAVVNETLTMGEDTFGNPVSIPNYILDYEPFDEKELDFNNKYTITGSLFKTKYRNVPYTDPISGRQFIGNGIPFTGFPIVLEDYVVEQTRIPNFYAGTIIPMLDEDRRTKYISDTKVRQMDQYYFHRALYKVQRTLGVDRSNYLADNHREWLVTLIEQQLFQTRNGNASGILGNPQLLVDMGLISGVNKTNELGSSFKPQPEKTGQDAANQKSNILSHSETDNPDRDLKIIQVFYDKYGSYYDSVNANINRIVDK
jgi:hypothetical protein